MYRNTSYTLSWASTGATVQAGNVACALYTSPGGLLAQTLVASAPALASQATFTLGAALASGSYTAQCASLADASVVATTPVLSLSGGALWVTSPTPGTTYTFSTLSTQNVSWGGAGGTVLGGAVTLELWYLGCCLRSTLVTGFPAAGGVWTWPTPYSNTQSSTPHAS